MLVSEVSKRFTKNEMGIEKPEGKDEDKLRLFIKKDVSDPFKFEIEEHCSWSKVD